MHGSELRAQILELVNDYAQKHFAQKTFDASTDRVSVTGKVIGANEIVNMVDASLDGWLTAGRFNAAFEDKLSKWLGVKHLMTVNSGSSANLVAFSSLTSPKLGDRAIKRGDEVISVAGGFPTTINPIVQFGAVPVFVDLDLATHNINVDQVEAAITDKTKAIMLAHALGNPFDATRLKEICDKYNLWLIEDCCDALGAEINGQKVGTFGDIATLSFYPAHHITMGEGGAVFTNNSQLKVIAESFRDWGRDCYCGPGNDNTCGKRFAQKLGFLPEGYDHKYTYSHLGYNLKISDMQAACALGQLEHLDDFIATRRSNFAYLNERLGFLEEFAHLPVPTKNSNPSWFGYTISLKDNRPLSRNQIVEILNDRGVDTRLLFAGNVTKQPYMIGADYREAVPLTVTDHIMNNTFWIGLHHGLTTDHLDHTIAVLTDIFGVDF